MNIIVFIAHPHYAELFLAGTILKHTKSGDRVYVVSVSSGELGSATIPPEELGCIRANELRAAAKMEGVAEVKVLNFKDTEICNTPELRMAILTIIREVKPDVVLTHWTNDTHPDLRETGQATIDACFFAYLGSIKTTHPPHMIKKVYTFGVPLSSINFQPDIFIDVTDFMEDKVKAAQCHKTMIEEEFAGNVETWTLEIRGENRQWGRESGVKYAEAFKEVHVCGIAKQALDYLRS
jgi:LmbE family N-acetylglucosaminyl deacetylase